jgi:hypothetical protein
MSWSSIRLWGVKAPTFSLDSKLKDGCMAVHLTRQLPFTHRKIPGTLVLRLATHRKISTTWQILHNVIYYFSSKVQAFFQRLRERLAKKKWFHNIKFSIYSYVLFFVDMVCRVGLLQKVFTPFSILITGLWSSTNFCSTFFLLSPIDEAWSLVFI